MLINNCSCLHISHITNIKAPDADTKKPVSTLPYENQTGSPHFLIKKLIAGNSILINKYAAINGKTIGRMYLNERHTTAVISVSIKIFLKRERVCINHPPL